MIGDISRSDIPYVSLLLNSQTRDAGELSLRRQKREEESEEDEEETKSSSPLFARFDRDGCEEEGGGSDPDRSLQEDDGASR